MTTGHRLRSLRATSSAPSVIGLAVLFAAAGLVGRALSTQDWDPTLFVGFGVEATPTLEYAEQHLGDVWARARQGHDGKFFFVQANDPLYLDPGAHAAHLDHPAYRAQRMLYPLLAGGFGLFPPVAVAWGMLIVNLLAVGVGSWGLASYARWHGWSSWWGLAFALNPGVIFEVLIGGSGALAFAAGVWGLVALQRGSAGPAAVAFTAAVLTREVMLVIVAGAVIWHWMRRRTVPWLSLLSPALAFLGWRLYLSLRLGGLGSGEAELNAFNIPFLGLTEAASSWSERPADLLMGWLVVAILLSYTIRALRSRQLLAWSALGFVPMATVLSERVWYSYFDITRAVAPALTAWVLLTFTPDSPSPGERGAEREPEVRRVANGGRADLVKSGDETGEEPGC